MKSVSYIAVCLLTLLLLSCSEDDPKQQEGYFRLAQVQSPTMRAGAKTHDISETSFDLGSVKASREFYFLLANGGDTDITNVELSTNNPAFIISPASISLLPAESSEANALIPMVSLGIEHGPKLNGVGYTQLLPMGENTATLTITGRTVVNDEVVLVESTFTFTVDAKTMDITLYNGEEEINYDNAPAQYSGFEFDSELPAIPGYDFTPDNFSIKNTGNVPVTLQIIYSYIENETSELELAPNEITAVIFPPTPTNYYVTLIKVDGEGTVTNRSRLKQGVDGLGYVIVQKMLEQ